MNTARFPSGETTLLGGWATGFTVEHLLPSTSHVQWRLAMLNAMRRPLSSKLKLVKGSRNGSYFVPEAEESASATFTWLNAALRVALDGSTRMNSWPFSVETRYQNRSSAS